MGRMVDDRAQTDASAPRRKRPWAYGLVALACLLVGFLGGATVASYFIVTQVRHMMDHPEEAPGRITARLDSRLDLSPDQEKAIEQVLRERLNHLHRSLYTAWPIVDQILDQVGEDIRYELNARQKQQWDELYPEIREQWFKRPPDPNREPLFE